jgi:xylose isomerase
MMDLNFDCKVRHESVDPTDLFIGHIGAMDLLRALCAGGSHAADGTMNGMLEGERRGNGGWEPKISQGKATLWRNARRLMPGTKGEPTLKSGKQSFSKWFGTVLYQETSWLAERL